MKTICFLLVFLILLQSCSVYDTPATVKEAVTAEKKVKVFTTDKKEYVFERLENNDRLTGIIRRESLTAKKLVGLPTQIEGKYLEMDLSGLDIEEIKLRNKSRSTNLTIVTVVSSLVIAVTAIILISIGNSEWAFGEGSSKQLN